MGVPIDLSHTTYSDDKDPEPSKWKSIPFISVADSNNFISHW